MTDTIVVTDSTLASVPTTTVVAGAMTTTVLPAITRPVQAARLRYAVPGLGLMAMGSALGALEITKRPRRGAPGAPQGDDDPLGNGDVR